MIQRWYQKASVQTAIVSGIFLLIGIIIPYCLKIPNLENQIIQLKNENSYKDIEIQKLQTQLIPFKTFALEHYQGSESEALAKLANKITKVESTVNDIRNYYEVAKLDFTGSAFKSSNSATINIRVTTPLSKMMEGTYEIIDDKSSLIFTSEAEVKSRAVIEKFPNFPFSYYHVAMCLKNRGDETWKIYAEKVVEILKITTSIGGHAQTHDEVLKYISELLKP